MASVVEKILAQELINQELANLPKETIDVKQAALKADQYLRSLVSGVTNTMLEEVELTDDEQFWLITLSYYDPSSSIQNVFGKIVKVFKIRRDNGEVMSMKIRSV